MDIKTMALIMYKYWIFGILSIFITILIGQKELLRIDKKALIAWSKFLTYIVIYRICLFKLFPHLSLLNHVAKNISIIPWPLTLTVFWEDACHGLPLLMLKKLTNNYRLLKPFYYLALVAVMIEFGSGHIYQGLLAAALLTFYIPYSIKAGEKYGFGTVMIAHTLFDLTTILSVKFLLGY